MQHAKAMDEKCVRFQVLHCAISLQCFLRLLKLTLLDERYSSHNAHGALYIIIQFFTFNFDAQVPQVIEDFVLLFVVSLRLCVEIRGETADCPHGIARVIFRE